MGREPPKHKPAKFKAGDKVEVENPMLGWFPATIVSVKRVSDEDLVRYAYCFFWIYRVRYSNGTESVGNSENLLRLAVIEQLGSLVDDG